MKRLVPLCIAVVLLCSGCLSRRGSLFVDGINPRDLSPQDWLALGKPGPSHKILNALVGEWSVEITSLSAPSAVPDRSTGSSHTSWILGDRFLEERFQGDGYEGLGMIGYDRGARLFTTIWMDSLTTATAVSRGEFSPVTNTFDLYGEVYDPLLGRPKETHTQIMIISPNQYEVRMLDAAPNGERFNPLKLVYRRKP